MKVLLTLFVILFSSSVVAEWTKITTSKNGNVMYEDIETIKIVGDIRYFYYLFDYAKPTQYGDLSDTTYRELNCSNMMFKNLMINYYSLPLGKGNQTAGSGTRENAKWNYQPPTSIGGILNKFVCEF